MTNGRGNDRDDRFTGKCGSDGGNEEGDANCWTGRLFGDAAGENVDSETESRAYTKCREIE